MYFLVQESLWKTTLLTVCRQKQKEKEYANGNVAVYLSISGITAAMFVIQVSPNLSVTRWLQELELEGITTVIRTVDGFLSQRFLSDLFDIESDSV